MLRDKWQRCGVRGEPPNEVAIVPNENHEHDSVSVLHKVDDEEGEASGQSLPKAPYAEFLSKETDGTGRSSFNPRPLGQQSNTLFILGSDRAI